MLAGSLREQAVYAELLPAERAELFIKAAPLHDIGKVGVPDAFLRMEAEFQRIARRHGGGAA